VTTPSVSRSMPVLKLPSSDAKKTASGNREYDRLNRLQCLLVPGGRVSNP
jgi:hypothetical protein